MGRSNGIRVVDNPAIISFEDDFSVSESIGSRPITVTRTGNTTGTTIVPYFVAPMTAGVADYTSVATGTLTFAPAVTTLTIANSIIDDLLVELTEQYRFELGYDDATWMRGKNTCIVSILDNDTATIITIASISSPSASEGAILTFNIALSAITTQSLTFAYSVTGTATPNLDYASPLVFSNGVTISGNNLIIPTGITAFTATTLTATDMLIESTETVILTIGSMTGTGSIIDVQPTALAPLTRIAAFEMPYGKLTSGQRSAANANNGGYVGFAVSRSDTATINYAIYSSATINGTYTKIADNIAYSAYAEIFDVINYEHPNLPFINEYDLPNTITADTIALIKDTAGQQELCAVSAYSTITIAGNSSKFFTGVKGAVYHSLPISVSSNDTATIQLLNNYGLDPTEKANAVQKFYKIVPKDSLGAELALNLITPISLTINGYANKPYRPAFVRFGTSNAIADLTTYPTEPYLRGDIYMAIAPASRIDETTPYGWFSPSGLNETGVLYKCDVYGADGTVVRTLDFDQTTRLVNYTLGMQYADIPINDRQYSVYALQGAVRSIENKIRVNQLVTDQGDISSVAIVQSGSGASGNLLVTVTFDRTLYVPIAMDYALSGTVISTNAFGTITLGANASFIELNRIQVTAGVASFVMTIPLVSAAGKTLTIDIGIIDILYTRTATITVVT